MRNSDGTPVPMPVSQGPQVDLPDYPTVMSSERAYGALPAFQPIGAHHYRRQFTNPPPPPPRQMAGAWGAWAPPQLPTMVPNPQLYQGTGYYGGMQLQIPPPPLPPVTAFGTHRQPARPAPASGLRRVLDSTSMFTRPPVPLPPPSAPMSVAARQAAILQVLNLKGTENAQVCRLKPWFFFFFFLGLIF
jgi:hypothetical protein